MAGVDETTDGTQLLERLHRSGTTIMQATPATWRMLIDSGWEGSEGLKILCGGEALGRELADGLVSRAAAVWNMYGPTETTIWSTMQRVETGEGSVLIGQPIGNTKVYVLDHAMQPAPLGIPGELYIGGEGLAQGYLGHPELTAARFVPDPISTVPGARLYKTGDIARLREAGIEYLGRIDQQVKVRGFRIELGEIEAVLSRHEAVKECAVVVRAYGEGDKRLLAYVVAKNGSIPPAAELRRLLAESLPDYMIPAIYVALDALPLTPNGKTDRQALLRRDASGVIGRESALTLARTPVEEVLAGIWAEVLDLKQQIGVEDNFFDLGGHSLLATRVRSRVRNVFRTELPLRSIFEAPTIAGMAQRLEAALKAGEGLHAVPPLVRAQREGEIPLSFAQQRLWILQQFDPDSHAFNLPAAVRLSGPLDIRALQRTLNEIVRRHEILHTAFPNRRGEPHQMIEDPQSFEFPLIDLRTLDDDAREAEVRRLAIEEARRPFDLSRPPLLRVTLLCTGEHEHVLLFTMHHIISDAWSMSLLVNEVAALYNAFSQERPSPLPELPLQYVDYAVWQQQWLRGEAIDSLLGYWRQRLSGLPLLTLPTDRPRPDKPSYRGARIPFDLPTALREKLRELGLQEGATLYMTLLAAFQLLLSRYARQEDIVIGTDVANRTRAETEGLIGFFVNQLVLRTNLSGDPTFRELLVRVRDTALDSYAHQDVPFEKLVQVLNPKRDRGRHPLFQVKLVFQNVPASNFELPGISLKPVPLPVATTQLDLILFLAETEQGLSGAFEYSTDLFDHSTIALMAERFAKLLVEISAQPEAPLSTLDVLTANESRLQEKQQVFDSDHKRLGRSRRQPGTNGTNNNGNTNGHVVHMGQLREGNILPLVISPTVDNLDLAGWCRNNRESLESLLHKHGAILFRDFNVTSPSYLEQCALAVCDELFSDNGELTREPVSGNIYSPVKYPADKPILWHNENTFCPRWPMKIWFYCRQPAAEGGETPIADSREVLRRLDPAVSELFLRKKIMYSRNYSDALGLGWQTVFQTNSHAEVEDYCRRYGIEFEWKTGERLRTRIVRPAVARHPRNGELVWLNQATHWHPSCLDPAVRNSLDSMFSEEDLPRNCYYGDGTPIEDAVMNEVCRVFREVQVCFPWRKGDVLMLDNMLTAHARNPYVGPREIFVAMGELFGCDE